jgi:hypothetical protein
MAGDISPLKIQFRHGQMVKWLKNKFIPWVNSLPYNDESSKFILIAGNHDSIFEDVDAYSLLCSLRDLSHGRLVYLEDSQFDFKKDNTVYKIYGTPYCKQLPGWPFCIKDNELETKYSHIPKGIDILVTHDAPSILDGGLATGLTPIRDFGNDILSEAIIEKHPSVVIFGHIHSSPLKALTTYTTSKGKTIRLANVCQVNEQYIDTIEPLVFDYEVHKD